MDEFEVIETTPSDISAEPDHKAGGFTRLASLIIGGAAVVGGSVVGSALVPGIIERATSLDGNQETSGLGDAPAFADPATPSAPSSSPTIGSSAPFNGSSSKISFGKKSNVVGTTSTNNNTVSAPAVANLDFGTTTNATSASGSYNGGSGNTTSTTTASGGSGSGTGNTTNSTTSSSGSSSHGNHDGGDDEGHGEHEGRDD